MVNFLIFVFAVIGMTSIIIEGSIFSSIRDILREHLPPKVYEIFECHQCLGFYCGLLCGWIMLTNNILVIFLLGCAGSYFANLSSWIMLAIESYTVLPTIEEDKNAE